MPAWRFALILPISLREQVRRHGVEPARESHNWNSSAELDGADLLGRAGEQRVPVVKLYAQVAAREVHRDRALAPAVCNRRGARRDGARPGGERLPAPRSHTPTVRSCLPSTRTSWTFVRSGKRVWCSTNGPDGAARRDSALAGSQRAGCRPKPESARPRRRRRRSSPAPRRRPRPSPARRRDHRAAVPGPCVGRRGSAPRRRRPAAPASAQRCACRSRRARRPSRPGSR